MVDMYAKGDEQKKAATNRNEPNGWRYFFTQEKTNAFFLLLLQWPTSSGGRYASFQPIRSRDAITSRLSSRLTSMRHPAYSSPAQVDAVAAYALPHALFTDVEEAHDQAHSNEGSLLAIAQSQLEGNVWNGHVTLVQASHTNEQVCGLQLDTGVGALDWCGAHQDTLVLGCDDGDVRLAQLGRTDGAVALIPIIGAAGGSTEQEDAGVSTGKGHDDIVTGVNGSRVSKTQLATCSWDLTYGAIVTLGEEMLLVNW